MIECRGLTYFVFPPGNMYKRTSRPAFCFFSFLLNALINQVPVITDPHPNQALFLKTGKCKHFWETFSNLKSIIQFLLIPQSMLWQLRKLYNSLGMGANWELQDASEDSELCCWPM